jgi:hypothetical protein
MWLLLQGRIQSRTVLFRKHIVDSPTCEICNADVESPQHIIAGCIVPTLFWQKIGMPSTHNTTYRWYAKGGVFSFHHSLLLATLEGKKHQGF